MKTFVIYFITVVICYLIGNIHGGILLGKLKGNIDIRSYGSGNAGATNTARVLGPWAGLIAAVIDILKAVIPVLIARAIGGTGLAVAAGMGVILGHNYPVFMGFKGGKGVASTFGVLLVLIPKEALFGAGIFIAIFALTRIVSACSIVGMLSITALSFMFAEKPVLSIFCCVLLVLVLFQHRENLQRLWDGRERPLHLHKKNHVVKANKY